ncbi:hypothetical protein BDQ17DRAFT_1379838 [Cyathus striatus]|nr:hypothetical protein BDQ17DRAFT_1379838 [Cyathus striatus]
MSPEIEGVEAVTESGATGGGGALCCFFAMGGITSHCNGLRCPCAIGGCTGDGVCCTWCSC